MALKRRVKKGFTLVELVVVIAVIAILAAVSVGAYFGVTESAKASKLEQEAKQVYTSIQVIGRSNSDNHELTPTGLNIVDIEKFEKALNEVNNTQYEVVTGDVAAVSGQTIILKKAVSGSPLLGNPVTYSSFEYFTPEVGNSAGIVDVVDGSYSKEVKNDITVSSLFTSEAEVIKALERANSSTTTVIKFGSDIEFSNHCEISKGNVILDLNGYTLSAKYNGGFTVENENKGNTIHDTIALHVRGEDTNVTLTGDGSIKINSVHGCTNKCCGASLIGVYDGSDLTIKNGTYRTGESAAKITGCTYVRNDGKIYIEGGEFGGDTAFGDRFYTFNIRRTEDGPGKEHISYEISGGTFYNADPAKYWHEDLKLGENEYQSLLKEGYKSEETTSGSKIWKVTKIA